MWGEIRVGLLQRSFRVGHYVMEYVLIGTLQKARTREAITLWLDYS